MHVGYAAFHYLKLFGFTGLICALVKLCLFSALSLLWDASCHCCYGWCNSSSCSGTTFSLFCVCRCEHQRAYKTQAMIGHSVDRWATRYLQLCTEMFIIGFRKISHIHFEFVILLFLLLLLLCWYHFSFVVSFADSPC